MNMNELSWEMNWTWSSYSAKWTEINWTELNWAELNVKELFCEVNRIERVILQNELNWTWVTLSLPWTELELNDTVLFSSKLNSKFVTVPMRGSELRKLELWCFSCTVYSICMEQLLLAWKFSYSGNRASVGTKLDQLSRNSCSWRLESVKRRRTLKGGGVIRENSRLFDADGGAHGVIETFIKTI